MNPKELTDSKVLETICVLAIVSLIVGFVFALQIFFIIALVLLLIGIFIKKIAFIIAEGWLKFAHILGAFNTKVILTLIFFLFLTPIAILYRIVKGDSMKLRRKNRAEKSYWIEKNHKYAAKDMENVW
jgi:hypothetical protein